MVRTPALAIAALGLVISAAQAEPALQQQQEQSTQSQIEINPNQGTQQREETALPQELRQSLESAGFTDVELIPRSFLVRAKDQHGNPVMMVVNPHSIMTVTESKDQPDQTIGRAAPSNPTGAPRYNPDADAVNK